MTHGSEGRAGSICVIHDRWGRAGSAPIRGMVQSGGHAGTVHGAQRTCRKAFPGGSANLLLGLLQLLLLQLLPQSDEGPAQARRVRAWRGEFLHAQRAASSLGTTLPRCLRQGRSCQRKRAPPLRGGDTSSRLAPRDASGGGGRRRSWWQCCEMTLRRKQARNPKAVTAASSEKMPCGGWERERKGRWCAHLCDPDSRFEYGAPQISDQAAIAIRS